MAVTHGMNVEEVKTLGDQLKRKGGDIERLVREIENQLNGTTWVGPDADTFRNNWWPGHKRRLEQMAKDLDGFGQSAMNNASEQVDVSRVRPS